MTIPRENVFDKAEYKFRLDCVREEMSKSQIDTLVLHSAPNILYLSGHHTLNLWDYQCLVVPISQSPFMVLWQFERGRFEATAVATDVVLYETGANPVDETVQAIKSKGLSRVSIGLETQTRYLVPKVRESLSNALGKSKIVDGSGIVDKVRNIKSEAELEVMRKAGKITDLAVRAGFEAVREGATDSDVAAAVATELIRSNSLGFSVYPIVSAGYRSGIPHNSNCGYKISNGDPVFIECSPSLHWYHAPLMRTAAVGEMPSQVEEFASLEKEMMTAMLEIVKPGILASEIAEVGKSFVDPIRDQILFHEVYGYPVGIGFPPTWAEESGFALVTSNHRPLQAGMVFHIPMTLRVNGQYGVGLSHTFVVTEDGNEVLSRLPLELHRVE